MAAGRSKSKLKNRPKYKRDRSLRDRRIKARKAASHKRGLNRAKKRRADMVVTTQKDAVRFSKLDRRDVPIWFMRVEIKITAGAGGFDEAVRRICFK